MLAKQSLMSRSKARLPPNTWQAGKFDHGDDSEKTVFPFSQLLKLRRYGQLVVVSSVESPMTEMIRPRVKYVIGPDGSPLTIADLPPANTRRWVIRRKAEVVAAVRGGLLSLEEACERYTLTVEEFLSWQSSINDHGLAGLRTTRIQQYRH
jgi:hypothetical protein